jgi:signal transduction histidine kinase
MELTKTQKWIVFFIGITITFILVLGSWWIYLASRLYIKLEELSLTGQVSWNVVSMLKWEGLVFFLAILVLFVTLTYLYLQDWRKARGLQSFFTSMTHELKTPIASIYLQSQVLQDLLSSSHLSEQEKEQLEKYNKRISQDAKNLEKQIDSTLQLAKLEWSNDYELENISLQNFVQKTCDEFPDIRANIVGEACDDILADRIALQLILRNLFQNTRRHNKSQDKECTIAIKNEEDSIELTYFDNGQDFQGDINQLGTLFYTFGSPNGSGIGLYLIKRLMKKLQGSFEIHSRPKLSFMLTFKRSVTDAN